MQQLQPPKVHQQILRKVYISTDLKTCIHVFVCNDAIKKSLQQPYNSPYKVSYQSDMTNILH